MRANSGLLVLLESCKILQEMLSGVSTNLYLMWLINPYNLLAGSSQVNMVEFMKFEDHIQLFV